MFSAHKRLDNLCVLVDKNNGQPDIVDRLIFPLPNLECRVFRRLAGRRTAWTRRNTAGCTRPCMISNMGPHGKPTAIICHTTKGNGGFSSFFNKHKVEVPEKMLDQELTHQGEQRQARIAEFAEFSCRLGSTPQGERQREELIEDGERMRVNLALIRRAFRLLRRSSGRFAPGARPAATSKSETTRPNCRALTRANAYAASEITPPP